MSERNDILCHYGVKGQKWGIRRYQNKDGSLTDLGKRHLSKVDAKLIRTAQKIDSLHYLKNVGMEISNYQEKKSGKVISSSSKRIDDYTKRMKDAETKGDEKTKAKFKKSIDLEVEKINDAAQKAKDYAKMRDIQTRLINDISSNVVAAGKDYAFVNTGYGMGYLIVNPDSSTLSYAKDYHKYYTDEFD